MATDPNTIPEPVIQDLLGGLEREESSLADLMCDRVPVNAISGTVPVQPSTSSLPQGNDDEGDDGLIPEGAEAKPFSDTMTEAAYHCRRAVGTTSIPDGTAASIDSVTGTSTVQRLLRRCLGESHVKMDRALDTLLASTTSNEEIDVNSATYGNNPWDDASSTPLEDIDKARDTKTPGADTIRVGKTDERSLKVHPDVVAEVSNFSAGMASASQLEQLLRAKFGFTNIYVGGMWFSNEAREGQSLSVGFDIDTSWMGYRRDLILTEFGGTNTEQGRETRRESDILLVSRRVDFLRPHKEMGAVFTNTTT